VSIAGLRDPGSTIDVLHPEAVVDGRYFRGSGTSQATAVTAGAVALLLDAQPNLTPDMVKAVLRKTATPIAGASTRDQGAGLINLRAASSPSAQKATARRGRANGSGFARAAAASTSPTTASS
jgi:serine protease AprX